MKILISDAFCSSNRGDAAILDGILSGLRERLPQAELRVVSHFPEVGRAMHGVETLSDTDPVALAAAVADASLVVSCGGSFLNDIYALNLGPRLATMALAQRMGVPHVVFAQSIGPLDSALSRTAARNALDGAAWILVRDEASARQVASLGVRAPLDVGVDAAVQGTMTPQPRGTDGPLLGVTVRRWHFPGAGVDPVAAQARYEQAVAAACDAWSDATGGTVRFLNNCTAYGGYRQDDRVTARSVATRMRARAEVVDDEDLRFDVVRGQAAACDLLLGTRMHSLIFATTAGVPAVGVAYEFKTGEWLREVGLEGRWVPIEDPRGLDTILLDAWNTRAALRLRVAERLPALRAAADAQLDILAAVARGENPSRGGWRAGALVAARVAPSTPTRGSTWEAETWRYDQAHRRLRTVVDEVLARVQGGRVLDVGCSTGLLGRMLGPAFDYVGIDIAESVTTREPRHVRVGGVELEPIAQGDAGLPLEVAEGPPFDVLTCSGILEYVEGLPGLLYGLREKVRTGGLAVFTLYNLRHVSRTLGHAHRHPTWRFDLAPDELALLLGERGFRVIGLRASAAGWGPPPSVQAEVPADHDLDGHAQLGPEGLLRLAHHLVFTCEAVEPSPGGAQLEALAEAGDTLAATKLAVALTQAVPWSPRVWADLGACFHAAGIVDKAREYLLRGWALDPARADVSADAEALGLTPADLRVRDPLEDATRRALLDPADAGARSALVNALASRGQVAAAMAVRRLARR